MPGIEARIYECRVTSVQEDTKTLHAISRSGRKFRKVSWLLPYINAANGGGFDFVPEVKAECVILSSGAGGLETVIGFKMPFDSALGEGKGRLSKQKFPPGSMGFRVLSEDGTEAKILALRGGTVIVGSGALANTVYSPLGVIENIFDSWNLKGPGGHVAWTREKGKDVVEYAAEYRVKTDPEADGFRVGIRVGTGDIPVQVRVTRKKTDPRPALDISVDKDGIAKINGNVMEINAYAELSINAPNLILNDRRVAAIKDPI
jgi:hypothetical protein